MFHELAYGRQLRDFLSVIFLGLFAIFSGMLYFAFGGFHWEIAGVAATIGTGYVVLRGFTPIKEGYVKAREGDAEEQERIAAEAKAEGDHQFALACLEIARMMSSLSDGELGMFIQADQISKNGAGTEYQFTTSTGSPVHQVLVAMADVDCTKPVEMKQIVPGGDDGIATYKLTDYGKNLLERFIRSALHMRQNRS